jgi:hypothetical protein
MVQGGYDVLAGMTGQKFASPTSCCCHVHATQQLVDMFATSCGSPSLVQPSITNLLPLLSCVFVLSFAKQR